jgi:hypothetical protein
MRSIRTFWIIVFMSMALVPIILIITDCAEGAEFFQLRKAAIEGGSYQGANHDYFLELDRTGERLQHTTDLLMNADVVCIENNALCVFWDNTIRSKASDHQYRSVAWDFRFGTTLGRYIDVGWHHISMHELDRKSADFSRFGLENVIYIQIKWWDKPRSQGGW